MNHLYRSLLLLSILSLGVLSSCRDDDPIVPAESEEIANSSQVSGGVVGFYLLNEGNYQANNSSLDYMNLVSGTYTRNIYATVNPNVVKELGDTGNDLQAYGSRLYAVINSSNKVEVLDAQSGKRIGQVNIPNCRYICFDGDNAYVSSYVSTLDTRDAQGQVPSAVYRVNLNTLTITGQVIVGYQPEEMVITGGRLYVANSGGYVKPHYERTISVVDLKSFTEVDKIEVGMNLHRLRMDHNGRLWVTSRGNYGNVPSNLYYIDLDPTTQKVAKLDSLNIPCAEMAFYGDKLYYYSSVWDNEAQKMKTGFGLVDIKAAKPLAESFITDGTDANIQTAYGLAIHPASGDIYIMDAKDFVSSGTLYCYTPDGKLKWQTRRTGMLPAHIAFVKQ
ncbi:DUF5074 domain-containing protein [uncultured Porphyromonas sp.]|uniref:DUF5074 domain-containing protein n=1 Tax=uncultured Porphyromonas sp. TaxID=159274 RepID=UPI0026313962|nr:DUF5074 domain-containing protein [uncultured Porphyromonas sp.]